MQDIAAAMAPETIEQIVQIPVLTPGEIEQLVQAVRQRAKGRVAITPAVMRLGADGSVYLVGASLEDGGVAVRLDMAALAVLRSFDVEGGLRLLQGALSDLPYAAILGGERPFVVSVRLSDAMLPLRGEWLRAAAALVASRRAGDGQDG